MGGVRDQAVAAAFAARQATDSLVASIDAYEAALWQPIETAPKQGPVLVYAPAAHGLARMFCIASHHQNYGWCIDELREATHWRPLPEPPVEEE